MIINGKARGRARQLSTHLLRSDQNECVRLFESRGTVAHDVEGALLEMEAQAAAVNSTRPLYHASISPETHTPLTDEQVRIAADTLERKLGLTAQPRVVVLHRKAGRDHVHVVWSRIDVEKGRAVADSWNYRQHEEAARELEALFGHRSVASSHRRGRGSPPTRRTLECYELHQEERSGTPRAQITARLTALWQGSADGRAFRVKLEEAGYALARGDRRVFVVIDRAGEVHSLARSIDGARTADVRAKMRDIDLHELPSVAEARVRERTERQRALPARTFAAAAQEVASPSRRAHVAGNVAGPSLQTIMAARATLIEVTQPLAASPGVVRPMRRVAASKPTVPRTRYRGMRAIVVAEFAGKIAAARRYAPRHELEAILDALHAERQAALDALAQSQRGGQAHSSGRVGPRRRIGSTSQWASGRWRRIQSGRGKPVRRLV